MPKPAFIKNKEGLYRLIGAVEPEFIISQAAALLLEGLCVTNDGKTRPSAVRPSPFSTARRSR